ncbi:hypothetical protein C5167_015442 [Papaver somniferum]|uniref:Uncharacterized protein n=1 Tax=Papaver somniferum TaxID=3469 RepID=A0A4Y7J9I2_PAPSO|nr:hypothetical protein C5167_015442 [Papaver somniferum]
MTAKAIRRFVGDSDPAVGSYGLIFQLDGYETSANISERNIGRVHALGLFSLLPPPAELANNNLRDVTPTLPPSAPAAVVGDDVTSAGHLQVLISFRGKLTQFQAGVTMEIS